MKSDTRQELPVRAVSRRAKLARLIVVFLAGSLMGVQAKGHGHSNGAVGSQEVPPEAGRKRGPTLDTEGLGGGKGIASVSVNETSGLDPAAPAITPGDGEEQEIVEGARPMCYSSPTANLSDGVWRKTEGGVSESPAFRENYSLHDHGFDRLHKCSKAWSAKHADAQEPQPYWVWEPSNCALEAVTEERFCRVMAGRKGLLLVGDSLSRLATSTLAAILGAEREDTGDEYTVDNWSACEGKLTVRYVRNDYLHTSTTPYKSKYCPGEDGKETINSRCKMFADNSTLEAFDTLVVNGGAHVRPMEVYDAAMKTASDVLSASMQALHGDDAILIVRNTVPGHWGCNERMFEGPANITVATRLINDAPEEYGWSTFRDSNVLLEEAFAQADGWRLLDAYTPTVLRPDSHIGGQDCLHYCVPGPADHWITLLYNMLLKSKASQRPEGAGGT